MNLLAVRIRMLMIMLFLPQKKTQVYEDNLDDDEFFNINILQELRFY